MYGFTVRPTSINAPAIDRFINYVDANHDIAWNLGQEKFQRAFLKFFPEFDPTEDITISDFLMVKLENCLENKSQSEGLLDKLIKETLRTRGEYWFC